MCQAENKSRSVDLVTRIVVCGADGRAWFCVCVRACGRRETARGQELVRAGEINWCHQVLLELRWLTPIVSGLNKKLLSFPRNPPWLVGQGRRAKQLCVCTPGSPPALRSRPHRAALSKSLQLPEPWFTNLQHGDKNNNTHSRALWTWSG